MNPKASFIAIVAASGFLSAGGSFAQTSPALQFPAPSPTATLKQRVGLTDIEIVYSRPSMKGRTIFGGVVPFETIWRTGANASTKLSFSTDVKLNGHKVPAGKYGLYTIPGEKEWTVIIHKNADLSGNTGYNETNDLVRFKVEPVKLRETVESFTIDVNDLRDDSATILLSWEKTQVPIRFQNEIVSTLVPQIDAAMAGNDPRKNYYAAAMFYYDHGQNMQKAKEWIEKAAAERETYYILHLKAKILASTGDKEGAIAAAKKSTELAVKAEGPKSGYVALNEAVIASLK